eukprot:g26801.t1
MSAIRSVPSITKSRGPTGFRSRLAASGLAVTLLLLKLKRGEKSDLGSPRKASRRSWSGLLGGSAEAPEEPSEQLLAALPELLDALRRLPQSLDDVRELMELLKTTQDGRSE